jgi:periplasmic divalent cation tolerance protein
MAELDYPSFSMIITTVDSFIEAEKLSNHLVETKLAACVNIIGPASAIYMWKSKIENTKEYQLWIKTLSKLVSSVSATINSMHSYDVPEIISFPFKSHNDDYSKWIYESTKKDV